MKKPKKTKAQKQRERMKEWFRKTFRAANRNLRAVDIIRIRDGDTIRMNDSLGHLGHKAIEEIRMAMILCGAPDTPRMRFDDIPKGSANDWSEGSKAIWRNFWLWQDSLNRHGTRSEKQAFHAVLWFSYGCGPREIEKKIRVRQGTGKASQFIHMGVTRYCEVAGWI